MIEYCQQGACGRLTINRPAKKNAFTTTMWAELLRLCNGLAAQVQSREAGAPRVLLLQGQPGVFCAGADIHEMNTLVLDAAALAANNAVVSAAQLALQRLPLPTIAVIDGPCFGGGFGLAAACDFRVASTRSSFAITPARLGLLYSLEDTRRVLALVGAARARRLLLRSERLDAATALDWGVLDALVAPELLAETAQQWAEGLAAQSATAIVGIKASIGHLLGDTAHSEAQVRSAFDAAFVGADFKEGAAAFLAGRTPRFSA
jgi:enoyl-CoA hydratase